MGRAHGGQLNATKVGVRCVLTVVVDDFFVAASELCGADFVANVPMLDVFASEPARTSEGRPRRPAERSRE